MKLAIILNSTDKVLIASRYKYTKLLRYIYGEDMQIFDEREFQKAKIWKPDYCIVFGSFRNTFKLPLQQGIPYILCDHDIISLYRSGEKHNEFRKIRGAKKIIFTSPDHQLYIIKQYGIPADKTMVLYLRHSKDDIDFEPMKKIPGKNLVYIGGLLDNSFANHMDGKFSYRCYTDIFKTIISNGWNVHLYAARKRPEIYTKIGCIYHPRFEEGKDLFRELSQYTAGLQGFANNNASFNYAKTCRPNKIWNYLAAGIPTIGINPGNGINIYERKWGCELKNLDEINSLDFSNLDLNRYRQMEIIENQAEELKRFIES